MFSIIKKISNRFKSLRTDKLTADFIKDNKKVFDADNFCNNANGPEVLFELNEMQPAQISYAYMANVLAEKHGACLKAYETFPEQSFKEYIFWKLSTLFLANKFGVFRSFGFMQFFRPRFNRKVNQVARLLLNDIKPYLKTKSDIESIEINNVWLGDLIYDTYLRQFNKPTIGVNDPIFLDFLYEMICIYAFWDDYFKQHDVRAINVSHCSYVNGFPLRIAVARGIPAYQTNQAYVYYLSPESLFAYNDFFQFRQVFQTLPVKEQNAGLLKAEERVNLRFAGKVGVDMAYSTKSAYGNFKKTRLIRESSRTKVFIATHCFFDSPHAYGKNLFPDFYEWLDFLGKISQETDYDWYIKTHPDYLEGTMRVINEFLDKYSKFTLLPADSSHHQIIAEGIDVALTCYGTIGFEYAALGIPVINASVNNPHINYNFNLHPKTVEAYKEVLMKLDAIDLKINKNEVYEYYFMKFIYNTNNWLFDDYNKMEEDFGGYLGQFTSGIFTYWTKQWNPKKHSVILALLKNFVDSRNFRLDHRHIDYVKSVLSHQSESDNKVKDKMESILKFN
uniref:hypothetical protein n=1 Tax=Algoriphagus sp. TaxID=1872435 RepID=UPI004047D823